MSADDAAFLHEMREFSRLYARRIGVFRGRALGLDHSLPEARVIEEIGRRQGGWVAIELAQYLGMDRSYMTRVLNSLEKKGLLRREPAPDDARKKRLYLTETGQKEAAEIERADEGGARDSHGRTEKRTSESCRGAGEVFWYKRCRSPRKSQSRIEYAHLVRLPQSRFARQPPLRGGLLYPLIPPSRSRLRNARPDTPRFRAR